MPGKYGSQSWTISLDDAPGGTLRAITNHVLEISGIKIESVQELSDAFGDSYEESTPTGKKRSPAITMSGQWDTTATTGPHAVCSDPDDGPQDATRTFTAVPGDGKTFNVEGRLVSYEVLGRNGNLTRFTAVFQPSGTVVWA